MSKIQFILEIMPNQFSVAEITLVQQLEALQDAKIGKVKVLLIIKQELLHLDTFTLKLDFFKVYILMKNCLTL